MSEHFYSSIAKYYQHIFPLNPAQVKFLSTVLPYNGAKILNVGCATGDLSFALSRFGFPIWAFDSDAEMIEMAQNAKSEETLFPVFEQLDMRLLGEHYPETFFDTVVCFGNTMVHLLTDEDMRQFIHAAYKVLLKDGKLAIQLLNYQHIVDHQIKSLSPIDNEHIYFERHYEFEKGAETIDFNTRLTIKSTEEEIVNSVKLYAIPKNRLQELLEEAGFKEFAYFGSFDAEPLTESSLPLIITCQK